MFTRVSPVRSLSSFALLTLASLVLPVAGTTRCETERDEVRVKEVIKGKCGAACPGTCAVDEDYTEPGKGVCVGNECVVGP